MFEGVGAASPFPIRRIEGLVGLVEEELCAYGLFHRQDERFRWDVGLLAAGSPRVDATSDVTVELWTALLELAIQHAGESGARRLFATTPEDSVLHDVLKATGFAAYTKLYILQGEVPVAAADAMAQVRPQHASDVWSIHQIYNRLTPRPVQFAEALTSDYWKTGEGRFPTRSKSHSGYVADSREGVGFFCRIETQRKVPLVLSMAIGEFEARLVPLTIAALNHKGLVGEVVEVVVPAYCQEFISEFLDEGFWIESERIAMVRHTTVPRVVQAQYQSPVPVAQNAGRRVTGIGSVLNQRSEEFS
ncbi:MAG: hypothetical protein ACOC9Y_00030 [Chloroflexota bacterium]